MSWKQRLNLLSVVASSLLLAVSAGAQSDSGGGASAAALLNGINANGQKMHAMPTYPLLKSINSSKGVGTNFGDLGPLLYNGGYVMPSTTFYQIFWLPSTGKLQNGGATGFTTLYQSRLTTLAGRWAGHPLDAVLGQYYQAVGTTTRTYHLPIGSLAATYVDTHAYPASGCTDTATPGNCITDAQLEAEIASVMATNGWTGGNNKLFLVYTSSGEGSCFDNTNASCAYTQYCGYHSFFTQGTTNVIYANLPYGEPTVCSAASTFPNDQYTDSAASVASHEISEAVSDPLLNAWYTASGNENGDLCAYQYGTLDWDAGKANQFFSGYYFLLQMEYDNHQAGCVKLGP